MQPNPTNIQRARVALEAAYDALEYDDVPSAEKALNEANHWLEPFFAEVNRLRDITGLVQRAKFDIQTVFIVGAVLYVVCSMIPIVAVSMGIWVIFACVAAFYVNVYRKRSQGADQELEDADVFLCKYSWATDLELEETLRVQIYEIFDMYQEAAPQRGRRKKKLPDVQKPHLLTLAERRIDWALEVLDS